MYRMIHLMAALSVFVSPARLVAIQPTIPAQVAATQLQASAAPTAPYQIKLDTTSKDGVVAIAAAQPNFDTDVLAPLRAAQAAKAAKARASARIYVAATPRVSAAPTDENLAKLRSCESGVYSRNSGNGYYGAYQYGISAWGGYGGYARADLAPAEVQDAKVRIDVTAHGWGAWPSCARRFGFL